LDRVAGGAALGQGVHVDVPTLADGDVVLRGYCEDDLEGMVEQCQDAESQRWTSVPVPYGRGDALDHLARSAAGWETGSSLSVAVVLAGRYAGAVELRPDGARGADLGFALCPWARGRRVASRAVRLMLDWGFDALGLDVVHWRGQVGNWPSRRVAWACGFPVEGRVRDLLVHRDGRRDAWVGTLRRGEPMRPATRWLELPELRTAALRLRANKPQDAERIVEACRDPATQRWLPDLPSPYTVADAVWYLESRPEQMATGTGLYWAVADSGDDRLLAQIGLMGLHPRARSAEIGYWTHPDARGAGVMRTAVSLVSRHALLGQEDGGLGLARVYLRAAAGNVASVRVAEKAGFTECGVDRRAERLRDGSVHDFRRFDLLAEEMEEAWAHPSALR
jgi:RimJ/RimL family protein N-acetyltransferase